MSVLYLHSVTVTLYEFDLVFCCEAMDVCVCSLSLVGVLHYMEAYIVSALLDFLLLDMLCIISLLKVTWIRILYLCL